LPIVFANSFCAAGFQAPDAASSLGYGQAGANVPDPQARHMRCRAAGWLQLPTVLPQHYCIARRNTAFMRRIAAAHTLGEQQAATSAASIL
jgi:hypothetical protein